MAVFRGGAVGGVADGDSGPDGPAESHPRRAAGPYGVKQPAPFCPGIDRKGTETGQKGAETGQNAVSAIGVATDVKLIGYVNARRADCIWGGKPGVRLLLAVYAINYLASIICGQLTSPLAAGAVIRKCPKTCQNLSKRDI